MDNPEEYYHIHFEKRYLWIIPFLICCYAMLILVLKVVITLLSWYTSGGPDIQSDLFGSLGQAIAYIGLFILFKWLIVKFWRKFKGKKDQQKHKTKTSK